MNRHSISANSSGRPVICIVGSGPAGFYTAQYLLKVHCAPNQTEKDKVNGCTPLRPN